MHPFFADAAHRERYFEEYIVKQLAAHGWAVGDTSGYDQNCALYPEDLVEWVQTTQPRRWERLVAGNGEKAKATLMDRLGEALGREGTVNVLRKGIKVAGAGEIARSFGFCSYSLREIHMNSQDQGAQIRPRFMAMEAKAGISADAPLPVEAGQAQVQVTVSGAVQLK